MIFNYNKKFSKDTKVEWLTKDKEKNKNILMMNCVALYVLQVFVDMLDGINRNAKKSNVKEFQVIYRCIFSGAMDPVGIMVKM